MNNILRERYIFRTSFQEVRESLSDFILRLRRQARKCNFMDETNHIYEQVLTRTHNTELRDRALRNDLSLIEFIKLVDDYENPKECYRCGKFGHKAFEKICEAKKKYCSFCGLLGHIVEVCKKRPMKRTLAQCSSAENDPREKRIKQEPLDDAVQGGSSLTNHQCLYDLEALDRQRHDILQLIAKEKTSQGENSKNPKGENSKILQNSNGKNLNVKETKNIQKVSAERGNVKPRAEVKPESAEVKPANAEVNLTTQNIKPEKSVRFR